MNRICWRIYVLNAEFATAVTAEKAGLVAFSLKDNSTGATGSATIQVVPGTAVSGVAIPALTAITTLSKSSAVAFTVQLVDAGGNPVVAATATTITLSSTIVGVGFTDANHLVTSTLTIAAGQSSVSGYVTTPASGTGTISATDGTNTFTSSTITVQ